MTDMRRAERLNDLRRLAADMNARVTDRQLEGLYDVLPNVNDHAWAQGMKLALAERSFPNRSKLVKLFGRPEARHARVTPTVEPPDDDELAYGAFRGALVQRIKSERLEPWDVAYALAKGQADHPRFAAILQRESEILADCCSWQEAVTRINAAFGPSRPDRQKRLSPVSGGYDRG